MKLRNYVVEKMPEKLGYKLQPTEKGRSPEEIFQMALNRVGAARSPRPRPPPPHLLPGPASFPLPSRRLSVAGSSIFRFPTDPTRSDPQSPSHPHAGLDRPTFLRLWLQLRMA